MTASTQTRLEQVSRANNNAPPAIDLSSLAIALMSTRPRRR
jgi:hypothetical protein